MQILREWYLMFPCFSWRSISFITIPSILINNELLSFICFFRNNGSHKCRYENKSKIKLGFFLLKNQIKDILKKKFIRGLFLDFIFLNCLIYIWKAYPSAFQRNINLSSTLILCQDIGVLIIWFPKIAIF